MSNLSHFGVTSVELESFWTNQRRRAPRKAAGWLLGSLTVVGWLWLGELAGQDPGEPSGADSMHSFVKKLSKNSVDKPWLGKNPISVAPTGF